VQPAYYGSDKTNADNPCNPVAQHEINENWDMFNFEGLDNDGDGLYDINDPDCTADTLTVADNDPLATNASAGDLGVQMQRLRLECSRDGDELCVLTSVTVHDTEVSNTGIIDSIKIYIDDDQNFGNGTLDNVRVNNWDGELTIVDLTSSISESDRTVGDEGNRYILIAYNLNNNSNGYDIYSEVTAIDVASPDNGASGTWDSNSITIGGPLCPDNDNDGFSPDGGSCGPVDCDDSDNTVHPNAQEVCDGVDNDCNSNIDDDITPTSTTCGVGECVSTGMTTCIGGVPGDTCTPGTPSAELCDGIDNDCDGTVDDITPEPTVCGTGECASTGVTTCVGGVPGDTCTPGTPSAEVCDGLDNDCNGTVDNGFPNLGTQCTDGLGECQATGTYVCTADGSGTECNATPGTPSQELCDGLDNDCDGTVDNITPEPTTCGVGKCASTGVTTCIGGVPGDTCTPGTPSAELCDGLDNNCNDSIDEDFTNLGSACTVGTGACEANGNYVCRADGSGTECNATQGTPAADDATCDGIDNDCNGQIDEDFNVRNRRMCIYRSYDMH
jgi:hypothetical protein